MSFPTQPVDRLQAGRLSFPTQAGRLSFPTQAASPALVNRLSFPTQQPPPLAKSSSSELGVPGRLLPPSKQTAAVADAPAPRGAAPGRLPASAAANFSASTVPSLVRQGSGNRWSGMPEVFTSMTRSGSAGSISPFPREKLDVHAEASARALSRARAHLGASRPRMAEVILRDALTWHDARGLSSRTADAEWAGLATALVQSLLKQPVLAKLLEAELLMWRCFELQVQDEEVATSLQSRRDMFNKHKDRLQLLHNAQLQTAARAIQRAVRGHIRTLKAKGTLKPAPKGTKPSSPGRRKGSKPSTPSSRTPKDAQQKDAPQKGAQQKDAQHKGATSKDAPQTKVSKAADEAPEKATPTGVQKATPTGVEQDAQNAAAANVDDVDNECVVMNDEAGAEKKPRTPAASSGIGEEGKKLESAEEAPLGTSRTTPTPQSPEEDKTAGDETAGDEQGDVDTEEEDSDDDDDEEEEEETDEFDASAGSDRLSGAAGTGPPSLRRQPSAPSEIESRFSTALEWRPSKWERLASYQGPPKTVERTESFERLLRGLGSYMEPLELAPNRRSRSSRVPKQPSARVRSNSLHWRPESYVEKHMRLHLGMMGNGLQLDGQGGEAATSKRYEMMRSGGGKRSEIMRQALARQRTNAAEATAKGEGEGAPGRGSWRPAEQVNEARLAAARSAAITVMSANSDGKNADATSLTAALNKYRALGLHDFDTPRIRGSDGELSPNTRGPREQSAAKEGGNGAAKEGGNGALERAQAARGGVTLTTSNSTPEIVQAFAPSATAATPGSATKKSGNNPLIKTRSFSRTQIAPMSATPPSNVKSRRGGGLGGSVSALLNRSRATRKAMRTRVSRPEKSVPEQPQQKVEQPKTPPADSERGESPGIDMNVATPCVEPCAGLEPPMHMLRDCNNSPKTAEELDGWVPTCTCDACTTKSQIRWLRRTIHSMPSDELRSAKSFARSTSFTRLKAELMASPIAEAAERGASGSSLAPKKKKLGLWRRISSGVLPRKKLKPNEGDAAAMAGETAGDTPKLAKTNSEDSETQPSRSRSLTRGRRSSLFRSMTRSLSMTRAPSAKKRSLSMSARRKKQYSRRASESAARDAEAAEDGEYPRLIVD